MWGGIGRIVLKLQRKRVMQYVHSFSQATIGDRVNLGDYAHFRWDKQCKEIQIGKEVEIRDYFQSVVGKNAVLQIGDGVFINNSCSLNCLEKITIGANTLFGENVKLYDHNHFIEREPTYRLEKRKFTYAPISIGKNCWLGSNVVILKGVQVGDNVIIGAGCVVHKDVPPGTTLVHDQNLKSITP